MIQAFLDAHNKARAGQIVALTPTPSPALPPVTWDSALADVAYAYDAKCARSGGGLVHNANRTTDYAALGGSDYVGENIYAAGGMAATPIDAVTSWMDEVKDYTYGPITSDGVSKTGHYTQVIWRKSVRIGCAIYNCTGASYPSTIFCDYAPGGNYIGEKPY